MKTLLSFLLLGCGLAAAADFPSALTYQNGTTIHRTEFIRWQGEGTVVVKHQGGAAPVALRYLSEESRAAVLAWRDAQADQPAATTPAGEATAKIPMVRTEGSVFIVTRGAGNYLLGGVEVVAFPLRLLGEFKSAVRWAGVSRSSSNAAYREAVAEIRDKWADREIARTQTDGEGKFVLEAPEPVFVVAFGGRLVAGGWEYYGWLVPAENGRAVLTNGNVASYRTIFDI